MQTEWTKFLKCVKKKHSCVFYFLFLAGLSQQADTTFLKYFYSIRSNELKKHLEVLASDAYEGRMTGDRGQKLVGTIHRFLF